MKNIEHYRAVDSVVRKHLSGFVTENVGAFEQDVKVSDYSIDHGIYIDPDKADWSVGITFEIVEAKEQALERFEVATDLHEREQLEFALSNTIRKLQELDESTLNEIELLFPICASQPEPLFDQTQETLSKLLEGLKTIRSFSSPDSHHASKNWPAMSVAATCREIWSKLKSLKNDELTGWDAMGMFFPPKRTSLARSRSPRVWDYFELDAPKLVHNDRPGDFGKFLEEIFMALEITNESGEPMRAASALRALRKEMRKQVFRK